MIAGKSDRGVWRRRLFILGASALLGCVVLIAYARVSKRQAGAFPLSADVPRGALLYVQFGDLPALVKRWDESRLKERYLASTNFQQFQGRHLALKLIERWEEFNSAVGFPLDALTFSEAAEKGAALAVYDVGRLEMVFVAPVGEEKLAATKFFASADQFEETELPDGTTYYSRAVEADGGRREQKFCFASARGRLILATSEPLLLRTLANVNGKSGRDRLSDDPSFKNLTAGAAPHFLTVWMDQAKLNDDWYFKNYWVMRNVAELKNIRACLLDLELQEGRWVEHREFLLAGRAEAKVSAVPAEVARRVLKFVPADAPYFKLRALDEAGPAAASLVRDTFTDRLPKEAKGARSPGWRWQYYDDSDFYPGGDEDSEWGGGYYSLGPEFDSLIDDPEDAQVLDEDELAHGRLRRDVERESDQSLRDSLAAARPLYTATVQSPRVFDGLLFAEFRKGAVITLQSPGNFRPPAFEHSIARLAESRLMIAGSSAGLNWADASCGAQPCRELRLPALGWGMYYALRGPDLVLANSPEMMKAMLDGGDSSGSPEQKSDAALHDLTVIRLGQREQAFGSLMSKLDAPRVRAYWSERKKERNEEDGPSQEFFSGNVASLLDVASPVTEIRIKRSFQNNRLREEVEFVLK
ncbi:MAG TPA: hypothetical protein VGC87_14080 [Pyrinomonadaceae bacterium]|jgi:hypothetical protein